jgi:hypothetical protein
MRAASLPSFLSDQPAARVAAFALFVALVLLTVLLVFAATGANAVVTMAPADVITPFRWLTTPMA